MNFKCEVFQRDAECHIRLVLLKLCMKKPCIVTDRVLRGTNMETWCNTDFELYSTYFNESGV